MNEKPRTTRKYIASLSSKERHGEAIVTCWFGLCGHEFLSVISRMLFNVVALALLKLFLDSFDLPKVHFWK